MTNSLQMIAACDLDGAIGKDGRLPWPKNSQDFAHFKAITMGGAVIMGRVTYEEILEINFARNAPNPYDVLPGRRVVVVSTTLPNTSDKIFVERSLANAVKSLNDIDREKISIFVIGGLMLFTEALPLVKTIHLTVLKGRYSGDRHLPMEWIERNFESIAVEEHKELSFVTLQAMPKNEQNSQITLIPGFK